MSRLIVAAAAVLAAGLWASSARAQAPKKHKIVLQISSADPAVWKTAFNNVDNLIAGFGAGNVDIKVVAYGPGLAVFKKANEPMARHIAGAKKMCPLGLEFSACSVTMKKVGVYAKDLAPYVDTADSGIVRVLQLQEQGYVYLRP